MVVFLCYFHQRFKRIKVYFYPKPWEPLQTYTKSWIDIKEVLTTKYKASASQTQHFLYGTKQFKNKGKWKEEKNI